MKISCIIPTFNQGQYIAQTLDSIFDQTVKPYEVICVNDGSTDDTLQIAKSYEKQGIKVINQVNKGLASARNTGIMNATGDYILPVDSDDILLENCLEKIEQTAQTTDADIIGLSFKEFGISDRKVILMSNPTLQDFLSANRIGYCSAIKRIALLEVGGYNPKMIWGWEDWHIWFDLLSRGKKLVTIPEVTWLYRVKENSMIHDANKHAEELKAQIIKDFPEVFK